MLCTSMKKLITVFGPSECTSETDLYKSAERIGALLADSGFGVVSGGYEGVMEAVSRGARSANGGVIGITAEVFFARGREANEFITKEITVKSAVDRLMELLDLADAYIACGVSPGTVVEVATAWDYMLKNFIEQKPLILMGKEWKNICYIFFAQDAYKGKTDFITLVETPEQALEKVLAVFGKQEKLPELDILS